MNTKYKRTKAKSETGKYPRTFDAIVLAIPVAVWNANTSTNLALIVDAMRSQTMVGHNQGYKEATT